jgi:hypothetical protein
MFKNLSAARLASLLVLVCGTPALAGGYSPSYQPECKIVYETHYKEVKVLKYKTEYVTDFVAKEFSVPRDVVETLYKDVQEVVYSTVTDYKYEQIDRGYWGQEQYYDSYGCIQYKKVWYPNVQTIKVPYQRQVQSYITKQVPYQVARVVYDVVIKKIPVQREVTVPYEVIESVPYQVAVKVCHTAPAYQGY